MTAPVVLVFYSPSRVPESTAIADDVAAAIDEYDGRFLAGLVDIDAVTGPSRRACRSRRCRC